MALTVTSRGTGTHNTGATTLVPGGRTATLAAGSIGVLCISADNAGSAGSALMGPATWNDAKSNVWTLRQDALYDNGAASAGIEMLIYTAPIVTQLLTTDAGTITWAGGVSPVAKVWTWYEVIPGVGNTVAYSTGGTIAGATAANAQVITASVLVGDAVIAGYFSENVSAVTGDSDSTNGSWTAQQTATIGSTTSGVRIATQQKVQTTAASTQSYDATVASQDRIAGYIMLHEVVNTSVAPTAATLTITGATPTVAVATTVLPTAASLTLTGATPAVTTTANQSVLPAAVALTLTGETPVVSTPISAQPTSVSFTLTPSTPTVAAGGSQSRQPTAASLTLTGATPTVSAGGSQSRQPDAASFTLSGATPVITTGAGTTVIPGAASFSLTGATPTVTATDAKVSLPSLAVFTLTGIAPAVTTTANVLVTPGPLGLTLTGAVPMVTGGGVTSSDPGGRRARTMTHIQYRPIEQPVVNEDAETILLF